MLNILGDFQLFFFKCGQEISYTSFNSIVLDSQQQFITVLKA